MLGKTLLGRPGRPEEVANVALILASDDSCTRTEPVILKADAPEVREAHDGFDAPAGHRQLARIHHHNRQLR